MKIKDRRINKIVDSAWVEQTLYRTRQKDRYFYSVVDSFEKEAENRIVEYMHLRPITYLIPVDRPSVFIT